MNQQAAKAQNQMTQEKEKHWKDFFNYKYAGGYFLDKSKDLTVVINKIVIEEVVGASGKKQDCPVCYFGGLEKPMILNKTNAKQIEKLYGESNPDKWVGKKIIVYSTKVDAWGSVVDAWRVRDFKPESQQIDNKAALELIASSKTFSELQANYTSLSKELKADPEVMKKKDEMKTALGK